MANIDTISVNGNLISWSSCDLRINNDSFRGFTSFTYSEKRERSLGYGAGRAHGPRGRSAGKYTPDPVKLKGFKDSVNALREYLAALAPDGISYGDVEVPIVLQFVEPGKDPVTLKFERCVWTSTSGGAEEGADPLQDEIEFSVMSVSTNGKTLYNSQSV